MSSEFTLKNAESFFEMLAKITEERFDVNVSVSVKEKNDKKTGEKVLNDC